MVLDPQKNFAQVSLGAENLFSAAAGIATQAGTGALGVAIQGNWNLSISGTWAGIITLQRSFDNGVTWVDVETIVANAQRYGFEPETGVIYRAGFKTGERTSGTAIVRISKSSAL